MTTAFLSKKRRAAPSFLDPRGGRAGRSPALGALKGAFVVATIALATQQMTQPLGRTVAVNRRGEPRA